MLRRDGHIRPENAGALAHIISAVMFLGMAASVNATKTVDELMQDLGTQIRVLLHE